MTIAARYPADLKSNLEPHSHVGKVQEETHRRQPADDDDLVKSPHGNPSTSVRNDVGAAPPNNASDLSLQVLFAAFINAQTYALE